DLGRGEVTPAVATAAEVLVVVVLARLVDERVAHRAEAVEVVVVRVAGRRVLGGRELRIADDEVAERVGRDVRVGVPLAAVGRGRGRVLDASTVREHRHGRAGGERG